MFIKHINNKKQACNYTKSIMTTSVSKNMIYRKLIEDIHVVMLRVKPSEMRMGLFYNNRYKCMNCSETQCKAVTFSASI